MAINEQVYGVKSKWKSIFTQTGVPTDEQLLKAIFLEEQYPSGSSYDERSGYCLGNALWRMDNDATYSIEDPNNPNLIESSCTFVGIAGDSPYTKIKYISNQYTDYPLPDPQSVVDLGKDEFEVVNTFFTPTPFGNFGNNKSSIEFFYEDNVGDSQATPNYKQAMWSPDRVTGHVIGSTYTKYFAFDNGWNARNNIGVITQLPTQRLVWYPTITCCDNNGSNVGTYDMTTFLNTYKTTKPRILSVQMKAVMDLRPDMTTGTLNRSTSVPLMGLGLNMVLHGEFDGYFVGRMGERTEISSEKPVVQLAVGSGRGVALGGYITGVSGSYNSNIGVPTNNGKEFSVQSIIDCGALEWNRWSGTGEGYVSQYLYCDASELSNDDIIKSVRRAIACFGMFFADNESNARTKNLDDAGMFLGILDNGIGYGDYSEGILNRNQPQWEWKDMSESPYDPVNPQPHPSSDWDDDMSLAYVDNTILTANKWYLISTHVQPVSLTFIQFMGLINNVDLETYDKNATFGLNPIDGVLQARCIYVSPSVFEEHLYYTEEDHIEIGKLSLPLIGQMNPAYKIESHSIASYICANKIWIGEIYEDFRNYSPYAKISFYDAFCGSIEIDPSKIMNKYISIIQSVNLLSGDKITSLYVTDNPNISNYGIRIATLHGNCSFEIPINGLAVADYARNQYLLSQKITTDSSELASTAAMGFGGASISAITGNPIGALAQSVGTIANTYTAYTHLQTDKFLKSNTTPSPVKVSNGSSSVEIGVIYNPCIVLSVPKMDENFTPSAEEEYTTLTGFAGFKIATPASLGSGTHVFDRPRINISGTVLEQMALIDQLEKGIYIKP